MVDQGPRGDGRPSGARADGQGEAGLRGIGGAERVIARGKDGAVVAIGEGAGARREVVGEGRLGSDGRGGCGRAGRPWWCGARVRMGGMGLDWALGSAVGFGRARSEIVCAETPWAVAGPGSCVRGPKSFVRKAWSGRAWLGFGRARGGRMGARRGGMSGSW